MARCIIRLALLVACLIMAPAPWAAGQEPPPVIYQRYDAEITIAADGTFRVREIQQIRFDGVFTQGFAEIPLAYTTGIDGIQVFEGERAYREDGAGPGSFTVAFDDQHAAVDWTFEETRPGDVRTFVIEYTVRGGLWIYPDGDILEWRAVPADRSGVPVDTSRIVVTVPAGIDPQELRFAAFGVPFSARAGQGRVVFEAAEPLPDGTAFQVQVGVPHGSVSAQAQAWQRAEDAAALVYRYLSLDADFAIQPDGSVLVTERHHIAVEAGALRQGTRMFRHSGMDDVIAVAVLQGEQAFASSSADCDYCFFVRQSPRSPSWVTPDSRFGTVSTDVLLAGSTEVVWTAPALVRGEDTVFEYRYTLVGALSVHENAQVFGWTIIPDEQRVVVDAARVRITLPPGIEQADVEVVSEPGMAEPQGDGSLLLVHPGPIVSDQPWQFTVTLPAGATVAAKPQWQEQMEAAGAEARRSQTGRARAQLLLGSLALVILNGGLVSLAVAWYRWGRDEPVPLIAEYLSEPPPDPSSTSGEPLAPGIVAYLLDEKPSSDGAVASLFHLAALGLLQIQLLPHVTVRRNWPEKLSPGQTIATPDGRTVPIPGHLARLFNDLASTIPTERSRKLAGLAGEFQATLPGVYKELATEAAPLFAMPPDKARRRWRNLGGGITLLGVVAAFSGTLLIAGSGAVALAPGLALTVVGVAWRLASRWMPQRSPAGAAEAARWRAFRRYLLNLKEYGNQAEAQAVLDRYFSYAVALDVQDVVLRAAEGLAAQEPAWTRPLVVTTRPGESLAAGRAWQPLIVQPLPAGADALTGKPSPPAESRPSLSGLSRRMGTALSRASFSLGQTLGAAARDGGSTIDTLQTNRRRSSSSSTHYSSGSPRTRSSSSSRSSSFSRSSSSFSRSSSSRSGSSSSSRSSGGGGRRGFR